MTASQTSRPASGRDYKATLQRILKAQAAAARRPSAPTVCKTPNRRHAVRLRKQPHPQPPAGGTR